tara:strand:- start:2724 stop:3632 length:909 start_codon:yes stop_codon:yes gene_type:complete
MKKLLLFLAITVPASLSAQDCADLFISEYVEGPANNNAIEIYNPTSSSIDLSGYTINRYGNGSSVEPEVWELSGLIASGDVVVVGNGQLDSVWVSTYWSLPVDAVFYSLLDDNCNGDYDANSTFYFNGNDAMTLEYNGEPIDIFGKVGEDPGNAWTDDVTAGYTDANGGTWWTKRQTLIRKPTILKGIPTNPILFDPTLEYDSLPDATYSELGSHICDCSSAADISQEKDVSYVMYPNPAINGETVSINSNSFVKNIILTNILGERIIFNQSINTLGLAKGTYIITLEFVNGKFAENKLIVE